MTDIPAGPVPAHDHWQTPTSAAPAAGTALDAVWPDPSPPHASRAVLAGAAVAGLLAAWMLVTPFVGVNLALTGLAVAACAVPAIRRRLTLTSVLFGLLAVALVAVVAVRDAPWLAALCVLLAVPVATYALVGGARWTEVLLGGLVAPFAGLRMLPWSARGVARVPDGTARQVWPLVRALTVTAVTVLVFGLLLTSADAIFGDLAGRLMPDVELRSLPLRVVLFLFAAGCALALAYTAASPPRLATFVPKPGVPTRRLEWLLPLLALDALLVAFAAVQAAVLVADDRDALLASTGVTYSEYARQGFAQLVVVTALVLAVLAVAVRRAPRDSVRDRLLVRAVLGLLCALTLVVVAVALRRLGLYEQAYGFTRLRLLAHALELWLGVVILLVAAAGVRLRGRWLPRAVAASGALGLLALAAVNPDALVASHNVDRFARTGKVDTYYLSTLSADAVPVLDRLPEPQRSCALETITSRLERDEPWYAANVGRARARAVLAASGPPPGPCNTRHTLATPPAPAPPPPPPGD